MTKVKITFTWKAVNRDAAVKYVFHNNVQVDHGEQGTGSLVVEYEQPKTSVSLISWALEFVGSKRTDLRAVALIDGVEVELGKNDEAWHLWKAWKVV